MSSMGLACRNMASEAYDQESQSLSLDTIRFTFNYILVPRVPFPSIHESPPLVQFLHKPLLAVSLQSSP